MRGETSYFEGRADGIQRAVAVLDLSLGGVHTELAEDVFAWFETSKAVAPRAGAVVSLAPPEPVAPVSSLNVQLPQVKREAVLPEPVAQKPVAVAKVEEAGKVWTEGDAGGVVMVVMGHMPDSRCVMLGKAMLAAAGLQGLPLGWVGYTGKVEAAMLLEAVRNHGPQQVLLLGQAPLGVLLGRNLGVEGWHAGGPQQIAGWDGVLEGVAIGVTYPLDLLTKQPLFKRLAWQHLLAWGEPQTSQPAN